MAILTGDNLGEYFVNLDLTSRGEDTGDENTGETEDEAADKAGDIPVPPITPLAIGKVRFVGQAVAMVIAETRAQAVDAAELVMVDVEPLEVVTDPYAAMEDGAPLVYDEVKNNIGAVVGGKRGGDVDAAFANAPIIIKERVRCQRLSAVPMEPRAVLATIDPMTRGLTFWTSTQAPHWNRNEIAEALGLKQNQVRCIAPEVGGGFGQKIGAYPEDFLVSAPATS